MIAGYKENKSFDYENGYWLTSEPYRLGNVIAHYELYKKILELPGDVIELGVFKGSSLIQFCTFRELLENEKSRKIVGFDMFGEFPKSETIVSDVAFVECWNKQFEGQFLSEGEIFKSLEFKGIKNVELVKGDITKTLDEYLEKNPQTRIALLHIDTDVYEPAKLGLEKLFDRVVIGGVVIFDDYATVEGETIAIEEYFSNSGYVINKYPFSHTKPSYIIKNRRGIFKPIIE